MNLDDGGDELTNRMMMSLDYLFSHLSLLRFVARIGAKRVVFGLVTPLDHPPDQNP